VRLAFWTLCGFLLLVLSGIGAVAGGLALNGTTVDPTTTELILLGAIGAMSMFPAAMALRRVRHHVWVNSAKVVDWVHRLRAPVVAGVSAYGFAAFVTRFADELLTRWSVGKLWFGQPPGVAYRGYSIVLPAIGILAAYLLTRQKFLGQNAFEFGTMLSFAIPGTVIGVSYILAFNVPPIEITGTAIVLIVCFIFRNMPVGVRAGMAAMSQIDKSLDEASTTLGARGFTTLRRVILPLLKPAIVAALIYSFVRAVTTVSAVIFLVSAEYEMATTYIINRVVNGDYGVAIAYCSVLIVLMLAAIWLINFLVGERKLGRRGAAPPRLATIGRNAA